MGVGTRDKLAPEGCPCKDTLMLSGRRPWVWPEMKGRHGRQGRHWEAWIIWQGRVLYLILRGWGCIMVKQAPSHASHSHGTGVIFTLALYPTSALLHSPSYLSSNPPSPWRPYLIWQAPGPDHRGWTRVSEWMPGQIWQCLIPPMISLAVRPSLKQRYCQAKGLSIRRLDRNHKK